MGLVSNNMVKHKNRTVHAVSFNPVEEEFLQMLMAAGGYVNFSEFAKVKILGDVSDNEKRLKAVETAIENLQHIQQRHHNQWVSTVKRLSGSDSEPLVAATYVLLHLMAKPQDRAEMARFIDLRLVERAIEDEDNLYKKSKPSF